MKWSSGKLGPNTCERCHYPETALLRFGTRWLCEKCCQRLQYEVESLAKLERD